MNIINIKNNNKYLQENRYYMSFIFMGRTAKKT